MINIQNFKIGDFYFDADGKKGIVKAKRKGTLIVRYWKDIFILHPKDGKKTFEQLYAEKEEK